MTISALELIVVADPIQYLCTGARCEFYAILGKSDRSLDFLEQSIQLNPANKEDAKNNSDFDALRDNPKFKAIVE
ncbi:MAG: hypothetical protein F6K31_32350 [Symploca sp. SIO2G7]|nr:hypothetical protein [Symploca sp. SIO2G7]